jgi:carbonic anhydrase
LYYSAKDYTIKNQVNFRDFLASLDLGSYYAYLGTRTAPDCAQDVWWTILNKNVPMSEAQLKLIKKLMENKMKE